MWPSGSTHVVFNPPSPCGGLQFSTHTCAPSDSSIQATIPFHGMAGMMQLLILPTQTRGDCFVKKGLLQLTTRLSADSLPAKVQIRMHFS